MLQHPCHVSISRQDSVQLRKMFGVVGERRESEDRPDDWDLVRLKALQLTAVNLQVGSACVLGFFTLLFGRIKSSRHMWAK